MEGKSSFNIYQKSNFLVLICYSVIGIALVGAYAVEVSNGNRTMGYYRTFSFITIAPIILGWIAYFINKAWKYLKYGVIVFYGILYAYVLFTGLTGNTFTYIYPMMVVITIYSDLLVSILLNSYAVIVNIIYAIYLSKFSLLEGDIFTGMKIQLAVTAIVAIFSIFVSIISRRLNSIKNEEVVKEKENVSIMLNRVLKASEQINHSADLVRSSMQSLGNAMNGTKEAMTEVTAGTNDSANSIQSQLMQTEDVQVQIEKLTSVSETITGSIQDTKESIVVGRDNIEMLREQVAVSEEASKVVSNEISSLNEHTGRMNTIVEMIQNVADQTSLLALNAAIEAARAGEAGRGFAVVAGEITNLANQTKSATVDINDLILTINQELSGVIVAVDKLVQSNKSQNASAAETVSNFKKIEDNTNQVSKQSQILSGTMFELSSANKHIVESVQTVSAIMEEVAAHATQTLTISEENINVVDEVTNLVEDLSSLADELMQHR